MALVGFGLVGPANASLPGATCGRAGNVGAADVVSPAPGGGCTNSALSCESSSEDETELPRPGISCAVCMTATVGNAGLPLDTTPSTTSRVPYWAHDTASRRRRVQAEAKASAILAKRTADRQPISHADVWAVVSHWRCSRTYGSSGRRSGHAPADTFGIIRSTDSECCSMTPTTIECKNVCQLLNTYLLQHTNNAHARNFRFCTIQINGDLRNPRGPVGCQGPHATTAAGPFRGGALRYPSSEAKSTAVGAGETASANNCFLGNTQ